ncbi:PstS family phosphate ABC transporter substrate-binding protein [Falsiroseomonas ponticola]|uniref:PstS family phosphate ABC transporter substrate-binding protein n=1 Tax=Falsiroseomonas ponticola TaxID=2786951 RepID=UPI001932E089|nr:substrate-binding domain-containing protein [Roseomonas ponticola]
MRRTFLPLIAALVALGGASAAAQPVAAPGVAAAGSPAAGLTLRDRLIIVSSSSSAGIAQLLAQNFTERFEGANAPQLRAIGSSQALELFCAGVGVQTPDIAITTRRMPRAVAENCAANGVRDIIELQVGLGAVVLAARRGEVLPNVSSRQVWSALAAEQPVEDEFVPNRFANWADIGPGLPRQPIRVIVPAAGSGTRMLFEDLVLEAGCRHVRDIRLIFEASYRRGKCVTLRNDGVVTAVPAAEVPARLLAAPPGTLAVMSYDQLVASGGNFLAVSLDGDLPTAGSIANGNYEQSRTYYLYAKRQHGRNQQGVGVVRGLREFLNEASSEQAGGPGGYLTLAGLVPLPPADRAAQRRIAERQTLMSR